MDDVIVLIAEDVEGYDDQGNELREPDGREVFCQVFGVTRNEFYQAAQVNMQPELTVRLSDYADYNGEKLAVYHGDLYSIIRTYRDRGSIGRRTSSGQMDVNAIELTLERKVGNARR